MNKIDVAIEELHRSENEMSVELQQIAQRHRSDANVFHLGQQLAMWSQQHVALLAAAGAKYGLDLDPQPAEASSIAAAVREKTAELTAHRKEPAMVLLADLRRVHKMAAGLSIDWDLLGQSAQALQDRELLALVEQCHPQAERQLKWAKTVVKEIAAQALIS